MNINFWHVSARSAPPWACGCFSWPGVYAIVEKLLDKYFPGFLDIEAAGASQAPAPVRTDAAEKKA